MPTWAGAKVMWERKGSPQRERRNEVDLVCHCGMARMCIFSGVKWKPQRGLRWAVFLACSLRKRSLVSIGSGYTIRVRAGRYWTQEVNQTYISPFRSCVCTRRPNKEDCHWPVNLCLSPHKPSSCSRWSRALCFQGDGRCSEIVDHFTIIARDGKRDNIELVMRLAGDLDWTDFQ